MSDISVGNLIVGIQTKLQEFKSGMQEAGSELSGFGKKIDENSKTIATVGAGITAFGATVTAALGLSAKAAADQEEVFAHLKAQVEITGNSWSTAKPKIDGFIESLQATTKYGDTDTAAMLQKLLIFTTDLDQAMVGSKLAMDMAASGMFGVDQAARMVGMAMAGNTEILGRYIPEFKVANNESLKSMDANQKAAFALDVLQKKFGGLAEKELNTFNGQMAALGNYFGDITENIGDALLPVLTNLAEWLTEISKSVRDWTADHPEVTKGIVGIAAALGGIATVLGTLLLGSLALPALTAAFAGLGAVIAITGPIALGIAGISTLLLMILKYWDELSAAFQTGYEMIIAPILSVMADAFYAVRDAAWNAFTSIWTKTSEVFKQIGEILAPLIDLFVGGFSQVWDVVQEVFGWIWEKVSDVIANMYNSFRWLLNKLGVELPEIDDLFEGIKDTGENAASSVGRKWEEMKNRFKGHMDEAKTKHAESVTDMDERVNTSTNYQVKKSEDKTAELIEDVAKFTAYEEDKRAKRVLAEAKASDDMGEKYMNALADMQEKYGYFLTNEQIQTAAHLKVQGEDYQTYVNDLQNTYSRGWEATYSQSEKLFDTSLDTMGKNIIHSINTGQIKGGLDAFKAGFTDAFSSILDNLENNLLKGMTSRLEDFFKGLGADLSGIASKLTTVGLLAGGAALINEVVESITSGGIGSKVKEILAQMAAKVQAENKAYYTVEGVESELKSGRWGFSREAMFVADARMKEIIKTRGSLANATRKEREEYAELEIGLKEMEKAAAAGFGYNVLKSLVAENPRYIQDILGGSINFIKLQSLGRNSDEYKNMMPDWALDQISFHSGGIIPGVLGQEKLARVLAGEEVLARSDPRHSANNWGGIYVSISGNQINSELDMLRLADMAGERIMQKLKLQVQFAR